MVAFGVPGNEASNPLGCPIGPELHHSGRGRVQSFQFGEVSWSEGRGNAAIVAAWQAGSSAIEVVWSGVTPYNYDFWQVRTDAVPGGNLFQRDVKAGRESGFFVFRSAQVGQRYAFIVQGCDEKDIEGRSSDCKQGWLNHVTVYMQANSNKPQPVLPDPPFRGTSCFIDWDCIKKQVGDIADVIKSISEFGRDRAKDVKEIGSLLGVKSAALTQAPKPQAPKPALPAGNWTQNCTGSFNNDGHGPLLNATCGGLARTMQGHRVGAVELALDMNTCKDKLINAVSFGNGQLSCDNPLPATTTPHPLPKGTILQRKISQ